MSPQCLPAKHLHCAGSQPATRLQLAYRLDCSWDRTVRVLLWRRSRLGSWCRASIAAALASHACAPRPQGGETADCAGRKDSRPHSLNHRLAVRAQMRGSQRRMRTGDVERGWADGEAPAWLRACWACCACCACWASPPLMIKPESEASLSKGGPYLVGPTTGQAKRLCRACASRGHRGRRWGAAATPAPRLCSRSPDDAACAAGSVRATVPGPAGHGERALRAKPCLSATSSGRPSETSAAPARGLLRWSMKR